MILPELPIIRQRPTCAECNEEGAFIATKTHGLVCGKCWIVLQEQNEDVIIMEAARILKNRKCP